MGQSIEQSAVSRNRGTRGEREGNNLSLADLAGTHLLAVMVRGTRWALEVVRVQTGPTNVGLAHLCLV